MKYVWGLTGGLTLQDHVIIFNFKGQESTPKKSHSLRISKGSLHQKQANNIKVQNLKEFFLKDLCL